MTGLDFYLAAGFVFLLVCFLVLLILFGRKSIITKNMAELEEKERRMLNLENTLEETLEAFELFVVDAEAQFKTDYEKAQDLYKQIDDKFSMGFNGMAKEVSRDMEEKAKELLETQNKLLSEEKNRLKMMEQEAILKIIREKQQIEQQRKQMAKQMEKSARGEHQINTQKIQPNDFSQDDPDTFESGIQRADTISTENASEKNILKQKEEKRLKVLELSKQGLNIDEIAKALNLTKGETKFILQLNSLIK